MQIPISRRGGGVVADIKDESSLIIDGPEITIPAGLYKEEITKSVEITEQATPNISIDNTGLITASVSQEEGYIEVGVKSSTKQLTVQAAQTITPGISNKTIASGTYLTGTQTIKGDANLVAANIKKGVSIFGVTGTLEVRSKAIAFGVYDEQTAEESVFAAEEDMTWEEWIETDYNTDGWYIANINVNSYIIKEFGTIQQTLTMNTGGACFPQDEIIGGGYYIFPRSSGGGADD